MSGWFPLFDEGLKANTSLVAFLVIQCVLGFMFWWTYFMVSASEAGWNTANKRK